jgi:hypothetical protein
MASAPRMSGTNRAISSSASHSRRLALQDTQERTHTAMLNDSKTRKAEGGRGGGGQWCKHSYALLVGTQQLCAHTLHTQCLYRQGVKTATQTAGAEISVMMMYTSGHSTCCMAPGTQRRMDTLLHPSTLPLIHPCLRLTYLDCLTGQRARLCPLLSQVASFAVSVDCTTGTAPPTPTSPPQPHHPQSAVVSPPPPASPIKELDCVHCCLIPEDG